MSIELLAKKLSLNKQLDFLQSELYNLLRNSPDDYTVILRPKPNPYFSAEELLRQLGGNRFIAMTGAKDFVKGSNFILFRIPRAKDGINRVKISLNSMDLYDMEFFMVRGVNIFNKGVVNNVYNDQLQDVFTSHTGLYTTL